MQVAYFHALMAQGICDMKTLNEVQLLRRIVLPVLRRLNIGDIHIRHHWTGDRLLLHFFRHKGYWYHGRQREAETMELIAGLVRPGDVAIEVGAHIGYISLHLGRLVGAAGRVVVFEPAPDWTCAGTRQPTRGFRSSSRPSRTTRVPPGCTWRLCRARTTRCWKAIRCFGTWSRWLTPSRSWTLVNSAGTRLDRFLEEQGGVLPSFIKIDVEGAEYSVLEGMVETLKKPALALMVEVTSRHAEVFALMAREEYRMYGPDRQLIASPDALRGNVFSFPRGRPPHGTVFSRPQVIMTTAPAFSGRSDEPQPVRPWPSWPHYDNDEIAAVNAVLSSGKVNYWTGTEALVRAGICALVWARHRGGKRHRRVGTGTLAFGIGAGDEVSSPAGRSSLRQVAW